LHSRIADQYYKGAVAITPTAISAKDFSMPTGYLVLASERRVLAVTRDRI
jgi:hypothetical protein